MTWIWIFAFAILIAGAAAIRLTRSTAMTVPAGAKAGEAVLEACTYKTKAAEYQAECGTLVVPENWDNQNSRLVALPVKRFRSSSPEPSQPLFYLGGGPGSSNMRFQPPDWMLQKHDVVLIGYRGVDGSTRLECPEYSKAVLGDGRDALDDESLAMMKASMGECAQRFAAEGVDLSGYTILAVAKDLEAGRAALGYPQVNLLSESYGTRIAQVYAYLHPDRLLRSAMIGVNPPGHFVWEPETIDEQIEGYSRLAAQDAGMSARTPNLAASLRNVAQHMPQRWLVFPIDPGKVKVLTFLLLFHRNTAAQVFDAYLAAEKGDASGLALMTLMYDLLIPRMFVWGDLLVKGGSADWDPNRDYIQELRKPGTTLGSPVALLIWGPVSQAWVEGRIPAEFDEVHPTSVETLLVSGSVDFSTPPELATNELLPALKNGRQVILEEIGHVRDVWRVQPAATERLLSSFYATGKADDSGYTTVPMDFKVKIGFPHLARLGVGLMALLSLGMAFSARWWERKRARTP